MKQEFKEGIVEVLDILNNSEEEITKKIPEKFINFLEENKDPKYKANINYNDENWIYTIKDDTKNILALIYRDYLADKEERAEIIKEEQEEEKRRQKELEEKYNTENLFKNNIKEQQNNTNNQEQNMMLVPVKEKPWYKRLYTKILSLFGKKKI